MEKSPSNFGIFSEVIWAKILNYEPTIILNKAFLRLREKKLDIWLNHQEDNYIARIQEDLLKNGNTGLFKLIVDRYGFCSHKCFMILATKNNKTLFKKLFEHRCTSNFTTDYIKRILIKISCFTGDASYYEDFFKYEESDKYYCFLYARKYDSLLEYYGKIFNDNQIATPAKHRARYWFKKEIPSKVYLTNTYLTLEDKYYYAGCAGLIEKEKRLPRSTRSVQMRFVVGLYRSNLMKLDSAKKYGDYYKEFYLSAGKGGHRRSVKHFSKFIAKSENPSIITMMEIEKCSKYIEFYMEPLFSAEQAKKCLRGIYAEDFLNNYFT
jgi:hypothetical protein